MWMIERFTPDHQSQILVVEMDIQPSKNCDVDYLTIRGNPEIPSKHCGTQAPPLYTATSQYTFIVFQSDHNSSGSGFKAVYTNIDFREMCGGIRIEATGTILSVDYDGDEKYEIDQKCVWVLAAPQFYATELTFVSMEIEWHKNCEWDYIRIYDGYDSYPFNGLTGWYCGNSKPDKIISNTNLLFIEFISDRDTTFAGFELKYRHINDSSTPLCGCVFVWLDKHTVSANLKAPQSIYDMILQLSKIADKCCSRKTVRGLCPLCGKDSEDIVHFMLTCETLHEVRQPFMEKLHKLLATQHGSHWWTQFDDLGMVQLILDNSKVVDINDMTRTQIWDISRETVMGMMRISNTTNSTEGPVTKTFEPAVNGELRLLGNSCLLLISIVTIRGCVDQLDHIRAIL